MADLRVYDCGCVEECRCPVPTPVVRCENYGSGSQCANDATHCVRFWTDGDEYESSLCPACFAGFREEMIKNGMMPRNEVVPTGSEAAEGNDTK